MNAFVNLIENKDYMTITLNNQDHQIKLSGTIEDPYFCGKDVCKVLGYKNLKDALQKFVDSDDKRSLTECFSNSLGLIRPNELGCVTHPNSLGLIRPGNVLYHEGKAVYINEAGLYSLALSSEAPFAKDFKRLICKTILPSIRKYGSYQVDRQLSESMALLAIREKDVETERAARQEAQRREEEAQANLRKQERFSNKLRDMVVSMKARQKDQIVYIATTKAYAKQNRFKVGGVKSRDQLKSRLSTYNSGRPVGDKMYYCFITETVDYHHLEQRINKILGDHKDTKEAEVYNVHYHSLQPLIEYLADRFDEEVEYHKSLFEKLVQETLEKQPVVPDPLIINGAEFRRFRNGQVVSTQALDFDDLGDEEKIKFVESVFEEYSILSGEKPMVRNEFESFVATTHRAKFKKNVLWAVTKQVAEKLKKKIAYR